MLSDIEIAQRATPRPIADVAAEIGLDPSEVELFGSTKAKVALSAITARSERPAGRYVVVSAITPTPLGEGKTLTTVGLGQAFRTLGRTAITTIRQPSLGPVFGIKGGAAGGGYSQVLPMEDFNLHLTGDAHAIAAAHNLCAAFLDNHLHHGNTLGIEPHSVTWRRVVDVSDRALRGIVVGLGGRMNGVPRESGFDIVAASELMAILALAEDLHDLRARIGRIVVATTRDGRPVTTEDLQVAGAMTVLMRDAIKPNLLQNLEGGPVLVHAGPFANIAHGNSSIIADRLGLKLADYVITESGFGADMGFEKFANVKCRTSGLEPDCAVLVCTVRALKMHSGKFTIKPGRPLDPALGEEDMEALRQGSCNLVKQIANVQSFGVPVVVAINHFPTDTEAEHEVIREVALGAGACAAVSHTLHSDGGAGGTELASAIEAACEREHDFTFTYDAAAPIAEKISAIATKVYGADGVDFSPISERAMQVFTGMGFDRLPVCMAKTPLSLSHDPALTGCPSGWRLPVRDIRLAAGAGFLYALCGDIVTMPGLPSRPAGEKIDIDSDGNVVGLF
ncbi:MAG: formate--tetrahydrofolate ligase [Actinobacteria bacterium]|nr:MAG: formate--tetrahydrofolate ligase [Actinomycetota bacterium]